MIGFVLSLTCCLSFVGVILGFIGLGRTKPANGLGARWAAIASLAIGIPLTLLFAGLIVFAVLDDSEYLDDLHTGDCFTATGFGDDGEAITDITSVSCTGMHDAEVLKRVGLDADEAEFVRYVGPATVCEERVPTSVWDAVAAPDSGATALGIIRDPDDVTEGDVLLCVAYASDGSLTEPFGSS